MLHDNPLKQYFRRPAVYLKLPSGGQSYNPNVVEIPTGGELPVYPMTAIDEITSRTPDALFNGTAVVELIKSCVPNIKDPWALQSTDLDAVLIAIKAASGGNDLELSSVCPSCQTESKYGVNLVNVLATMKSGNYAEELTFNDLVFKFRPLNYKEMNEASLKQFEVQKMFAVIEKMEDNEQKATLTKDALSNITDITMKILSKAIEYIKTPSTLVDNPEYIYDFLKNCDKNTYTEIRDYNAKLKTSTEIKPLDIKCVECSHDYKQPFTLNLSDFFV